jgi:hypothetical protein
VLLLLKEAVYTQFRWHRAEISAECQWGGRTNDNLPSHPQNAPVANGAHSWPMAHFVRNRCLSTVAVALIICCKL